MNDLTRDNSLPSELARAVFSIDSRMFALGINSDVDRYREIVHGRVREELRRFLTNDELIGRKDGDYVSVPLPRIDLPHFEHDSGKDGVGQGEGEVGDVFGNGGQQQDGAGQEGGLGAGRHVLEERVSVEELARMLGEELELPRIEPKGKQALERRHDRYNSISRVGPDSLRHNKRTFREALLREIASGSYDPDDPQVVPVRDDYRYKAPNFRPVPKFNAAIVYLMDVSGSMSDEHKAIARITSFWINAWLDAHYKGCSKVFIVHDDGAREVDEDTFFRTRESGGTRISTAYEKAREVIEQRFPPDQWNIYMFQFSDGDNYTSDNAAALELMREKLLPGLNLFAFAKIKGQSWGENYYDRLAEAFHEKDQVVLTEIAQREAIPAAIKAMLSTGN